MGLDHSKLLLLNLIDDSNFEAPDLFFRTPVVVSQVKQLFL